MYWLKRKPIILTIVMVLAAAVLLTACGPGSTGEGGQADDSPEILYMGSLYLHVLGNYGYGQLL